MKTTTKKPVGKTTTKIKVMNVKLKDKGETISFGGKRQPITAQNLTPEIYTMVISEFPSLKEKFEVIEDEDPKQIKAKKE